MVTDTSWAIVAPYLWIFSTDPHYHNADHFTIMDILCQLFFFSNTIFSVFLLYTLSFFHQLNPKKETLQPEDELTDTKIEETKENEGESLHESFLKESFVSTYPRMDVNRTTYCT